MTSLLTPGIESYIQTLPDVVDSLVVTIGMESYSLESLALELSDVRTTISKSGMAREDAEFLQNIDPALVPRRIESYTELPSFTNVVPSVESIGTKLKEIGANLAKRILEFLKTVWNHLLKMIGFRKDAKVASAEAHTKIKRAETVIDIVVDSSISPTVTADDLKEAAEEVSRVKETRSAVDWSMTQFVLWIIEGNRIERFNELTKSIHGLTGILQAALTHYTSLLNDPSVKHGADTYAQGYAASGWETAAGSRVIESALESLEKTINRFGFKHPPRDRQSSYGANVVTNISAVYDELKRLNSQATTKEIPPVKSDYVDKLNMAIQTFEVEDKQMTDALDKAIDALEAVVNKPVSVSKEIEDTVAKDRIRLLSDYRALIIDLLQAISKAQSVVDFGMAALVRNIEAIAKYRTAQMRAVYTVEIGGRVAISEARKQMIIDFYEGKIDHIPAYEDFP